jgi:hypothetical protein
MPQIAHTDFAFPHADSAPHADFSTAHVDNPGIHTDAKNHSDIPKRHEDSVPSHHTDTSIGGRHTDQISLGGVEHPPK